MYFFLEVRRSRFDWGQDLVYLAEVNAWIDDVADL